MRVKRLCILSLAIFIGFAADGSVTDAFFASETRKLSDACLTDIKSLGDWKTAREKRVQELREMLGLDPMPEKTDLKPVITGKLDGGDFTVEKLHFQSMPGLYVTANLYLPKTNSPAPAILYVCGHASVVTNGVSCGGKTFYQHHGKWFARNGYVCLIIDTIELGEIHGNHHGTYKGEEWWWNSRGYTPAGVEAWNGIRALDYLETRPEVDPKRLGVTGRSGGGAYSWWIAALDQRIKVAAPVAGITDLENHVVDGVVRGHCDCMFMINTYRWDYPMVAALVAPRPLLLGNSDKDVIFPLRGVERLHQKVADIYQLYKASDNFGLLITAGPHKDTQDLQLPVFRWFNRHLKNEDPVIEMAATPAFPPQQLKVFESVPKDERTSKIQESFVAISDRQGPDGPGRKNQLIKILKEQVFRAWPAGEPEPRKVVETNGTDAAGAPVRRIRFESQENVPVELSLRGDHEAGIVSLTVGSSAAAFSTTTKSAIFLPRGVGADYPTSMTRKEEIQLRRRYMLIGETIDSMRVWDIRCAIRYLARGGRDIELEADGPMAVNALYAALFEPSVKKLKLSGLPQSQMAGPDYLNVLRYTDIPEILRLVGADRNVTAKPSPKGN